MGTVRCPLEIEAENGKVFKTGGNTHSLGGRILCPWGAVGKASKTLRNDCVNP